MDKDKKNTNCNYKLLNGNCLNLLKMIPDNSVDMVLCDLPYGLTNETWDSVIPMNDFIVFNNKNLEFTDFAFLQYKNNVSFEKTIERFEKEKQMGLWSLYKKIVKPNGAILLFGNEPFSSYLRTSNKKSYKYDWYWEKERLTNIAQVRKRAGKTVETISVFYDKQPTYNPQMSIYTGPLRKNKVKNGKLGKLTDNQEKSAYEYHDNGTRYPTQILKFKRDILTSNLHPTQKPVALLEYLIKTYTNEGDLVLDNTMGSGSTGIACLNINRKFMGIEIDEKFYEISKLRMKEHLEKIQNETEKNV